MAKRGENIYKRKDGRYEGRYVMGKTENGKTKFGYIYGKQYHAVRAELVRMKSRHSCERKASSITLRTCMERYLLDEVQANVKTSTYQIYRGMCERHIYPVLGHRAVGRIAVGDVQAFVQQLTESNRSVSTIRSACRLLSACMRYAQEEGHIARNPCRRMKLHAQSASHQRVLSQTEQEMLQKTALQQADLSTLLAIYTGLRLGEICALKWTDINWERGTITVLRTVQRVQKTGGHTMLLIGTPKSLRSRREVPVPAFILDLLRRQMALSGSEFLFANGRPADPRTIQRRFHRLIKPLGIVGAHFHTLRHSFATRLFEMGVDIKTVSVLLGHSTTQITLDFYAHTCMDTQRAAVEKLASL